MQRYTTKKHLGSYTISAQLVKQLTGFLSTTLPAMLSSDLSVLSAEDKTAVTIIYPGHAVKYPTTAEYPDDAFTGRIEGLQLELAHLIKFQDCSKAIVVRISFSAESGNNYLYMALQDDNAEKELSGIETKLLSLLEQYKNNNSRIYRSEWFPPTLFVLGGLFGSLTFLAHAQPLRTLYGVLFGLCIYLFAFRYIYGYCTFTSTRQKRVSAFFKLFTVAIAVFIVAVLFFT